MFRTQPITRDKYFTDAELCQIYSWLWVHRFNEDLHHKIALVRLVFGTGLRVSEIPSLRKPDDCGQDGIIIVRRSKSGLMRQVKCMPEFMPSYRERWNSLPDGLWFPRTGRGPYTTRALQKWWHEIMVSAGVRDLSIHAGRHTYATWELASRRLLDYEVQAQLGHRSGDMTRAFYSHAITEHLYEDGPPAWRKIALEGPGKGRLQSVA